MFPTRTAGEKGRVGGPYGVRNCALAAGAVSGRFRPPHAASEPRIKQTGKRTRMTPPGVENGEKNKEARASQLSGVLRGVLSAPDCPPTAAGAPVQSWQTRLSEWTRRGGGFCQVDKQTRVRRLLLTGSVTVATSEERNTRDDLFRYHCF